MDYEALLNRLDVPDVESNHERDISKFDPTLSIEDAYRLQFGLMERRLGRNGPVVGYQASYTSPVMKGTNPRFPAPLFGTLLQSNLRSDHLPLPVETAPYGIEAEIGVLMKHDLSGPGVTHIDAHRCVEGVFAAIECAAARPRDANGNALTSPQHLIATHNTKSFILFGNRMVKPTTDLRLEGIIVSVNGAPFSSATGVEALGGPMHVVAAMANWLAKYDKGLKAGQILITGACPARPQLTKPGTSILVEYTTLGNIQICL